MDVYGALADPTRRKILQLLREREMTAGELAAHFPLSKATLSRHFNVLYTVNLVARRRAGTQIRYRLQADELKRVLGKLSADFQLNRSRKG